MDAKEKAKELFEKMRNEVGCSDFHVPKFITGISMKSKEYEKVLNDETDSLAKQCALIAVDEIISDYTNRLTAVEIDFNTNPNPIDYWESVKTELNKTTQ